MTSENRPTAPLREEHRDLLPHVRELDSAADEVEGWDRAEAARRLGAMVGFLREHLVPHASAEEQILYPAVEQAMGAPGAMATMVADHVEIVRRIERLAQLVDGLTAGVGGAWPDAGRTRDIRHELIGLAAILLLHFAKEEDVLLPVLDARLSPAEAERLFEQMGHAAHH